MDANKRQAMILSQIEPLAQALLDQLSSACVRIEINGSIVRRKPEPHDIELCAIPALGHYTVSDMFGDVREEHTVNLVDDALDTLIGLGAWEFDPVTRRNGPHYKRLRHAETLVCCDLFITDARRWGVIATIRTGPGDFSKSLVRYAHRRGMFVQAGLLHGHPPVINLQGNVRDCPLAANCPQIVDTPEERDVFTALGLRWVEPWLRDGSTRFVLGL